VNRTSTQLIKTRSRVDHAEQNGRTIAREQQGWLVPLGRSGFAANGVVYLIVGALAAQASIGAGGDTTDTGGALGHIVEAPFGRLLLVAVALGLTGYAVWRTLQALLDTDGKGDEPKGLVARAGFGITAVVYAGLALSAAGMALGRSGAPDQEGQTQDRTAWLMSQPMGPWLVVLAGLAVICIGAAQFVQAYRASFTEQLRENEMSNTERQAVEVAGRVGYAARGAVFAVVGAFLVTAGVQQRPDEARGLGGALAALATQPFGPWLLGCVAVGLAAYGAYMLSMARYRRMVLGAA
jgi:hypothetical protein